MKQQNNSHKQQGESLIHVLFQSFKEIFRELGIEENCERLKKQIQERHLILIYGIAAATAIVVLNIFMFILKVKLMAFHEEAYGFLDYIQSMNWLNVTIIAGILTTIGFWGWYLQIFYHQNILKRKDNQYQVGGNKEFGSSYFDELELYVEDYESPKREEKNNESN